MHHEQLSISGLIRTRLARSIADSAQYGQLSNCSAPAPSLKVVASVWFKLAWQENAVQDTLLATLRFTPMTSE